MKYKQYEANKVSLKLMFLRYEFDIPEYQRQYSWENKQLEDLIEVFENLDEDGYGFLGQVVLAYSSLDHQRQMIAAKDDDEKDYDAVARSAQVVDGQQRLTSLTFEVITILIILIHTFLKLI